MAEREQITYCGHCDEIVPPEGIESGGNCARCHEPLEYIELRESDREAGRCIGNFADRNSRSEKTWIAHCIAVKMKTEREATTKLDVATRRLLYDIHEQGWNGSHDHNLVAVKKCLGIDVD